MTRSMDFKGLLAIFVLCFLVTPASSEGLLDTLKKGVKAVVKTLVGKIFSDSREQICKESDDKLAQKIASLKCLESYARSLGQISMYTDCWDRYNKIPHPVTHQQWAEFYCKNDHHEMYKNIADHCFIRQLALNGTILVGEYTEIKKCAPMLPIVYDSMGIKRVREEDAHNATLKDKESGDKNPSSRLIDCSAKTNAKLMYCRKKYEKVAHLCVKPNKDKQAKDLKAWTCYETTLLNSPRGMDSLKECWNLTTGIAYPNNSKEFLNFTCTFDYPHAYRPLIKECMEELNQITYKDMKAVKKNCRKDFYSFADIVVTQELKRAFRDRITAQARAKMCTTLNPEKYVADKKTSKIKCYADILQKEREISVLNYCFTIGSREGGNIPAENRQWFEYLCPKNSTYLEAVSQDKTILDCFEELMEESKMKIPVIICVALFSCS